MDPKAHHFWLTHVSYSSAGAEGRGENFILGFAVEKNGHRIDEHERGDSDAEWKSEFESAGGLLSAAQKWEAEEKQGKKH